MKQGGGNWWFWSYRNKAREADIRSAEIVEIIDGQPKNRTVMSSTIKPVLNAMVQYVSEDGTCHPSMRSLADDINACVKSVFRAIKSLVSMSIVKIRGRFKGCNMYSIDFEKLESMKKKDRQQTMFEAVEESDSPATVDNLEKPVSESDSPAAETTKTEVKCVKAHDDKTRTGAPKPTAPGKTEHGKLAVIHSRLRKQGVVKISAAKTALKRITHEQVMEGLDEYERIKVGMKLDPGAIVFWLENGSWPKSIEPTSDARRDRFRREAEAFERVLVFSNGRSIDGEFLKRHWWPLFESGLTCDEAFVRFAAICREKSVLKVGK